MDDRVGVTAGTLSAQKTVDTLIVDEQELTRFAYRCVVESLDNFRVVGEAPDSQRALDLVGTLQPDIFIFDLPLPGCDLTWVRHICECHPNMRLLAVSKIDHNPWILRLFEIGVSVLDSKAPLSELRYALETMARGSTFISPEGTRYILSLRSTGGSSGTLSTRERDVLSLMAQGFNNQEIASQLWVEVNTVKSHVGRILRKLGASDRTKAVVVAMQRGLVQHRPVVHSPE